MAVTSPKIQQQSNHQKVKRAMSQVLTLLSKSENYMYVRSNSNPNITVQFCLKVFYQFSKTINKPLWLRMARIEVIAKLKKLIGPPFSSSLLT